MTNKQEPTTKESSTVEENRDFRIIEGVEEALEELKIIQDQYNKDKVLFWGKEWTGLQQLTHDLAHYSKNLVNALEEKASILACSNKQETPVSSMVEQASKSIWKPISELPDLHCDVIYKNLNHENVNLGHMGNGNIFNKEGDRLALEYIPEFTTFADFISQQENLERRIERLEQKEGK